MHVANITSLSKQITVLCPVSAKILLIPSKLDDNYSSICLMSDITCETAAEHGNALKLSNDVLSKGKVQLDGVAVCNVQLQVALKLTYSYSAISTSYLLIPLDVVVVVQS